MALLGLSSLFAVYLVLLLVQPAGTSEIVRWLYNVLLVGSAFVCLSSPSGGRETGSLAVHRDHAAAVGGGRLLLHALPLESTVTPPTVTDWLWLVSYPFLYAGIGLLVRARTAHFERSLWLDAALAALAVAAVGAAVLFGAVVESTGGSPLIAAMNLAYPLADALLLGMVVAVLAITGWRLDRAWSASSAARRRSRSRTAASSTRRSARGPAKLSSTPAGRSRCSSSPPRPGSRRGARRRSARGRPVLALPAVFGLTSLAILVYGQFQSLNTPAVVLAATSMLAVIARMAFTFREKMQLLAATRIEARTDPLTGVGNRRKLMTI